MVKFGKKDRVQRVGVRNSGSLMFEHIVRIGTETKWINSGVSNSNRDVPSRVRVLG